jgi:DNA-binding CsgD family transcriptional regulator
MRSYLKFITIAFLFVYTCSFGQPSVINITKTTVGASKQNWGVSCDTNGYVYFANNNGLLEYYGHSWKLYKLPEKLTVRSVNVDPSNGRIYTGAYQEFGYWQRGVAGNLTYHSISNNLKKEQFNNDEIWRIVFHHGKVYFQSFYSIFIYANDTVKIISLDKNMVFLCKARERLFVQVEQMGLYEIINDEFSFIAGSEIVRNGLVRTILPYGETEFLIGSGTKGLYIFDNKSFIEWQAPIQQLIKDKQINNGYFDGENYYLGTIMNGFYVFDKKGENILNYSAKNYLQNNTVLGITKSNDSNVWLALDRGIDVLNPANFFHIFKTEKNILGSVYSAALFDDNIYIATNRGVYYSEFYKKDLLDLTLEEFKEVKGIKGQTWYLKNTNNQLLCGNNEGSFIISGDKSKKISEVSGGYTFKPMKVGNKEYLIQCTYQHIVLYEYTNNTWKQKHVFNELNEPFTEIEIGEERYVWASHYLKGVYRLHLNHKLNKIESVNFYSTNKGLPSIYYNRVFKIGNRIVFMTQKGIYTYDDLTDTIIPFSRIAKEIGEFNYSQKIIPIGKEKYWFIKDNNAALFRINQDSINLIISYDLNDLKVSMVEQYENIVALNDTLSLACLDNGFALTSNSRKNNSSSESDLVFTKIRYNITNRKKEELLLPLKSDKVELPHGKSELKFYFSATNQINKNINYQYFLQGYDNSWSALNKETEINIYHLDWGEYKLLIRGVSDNAVQIPEISYEFKILTPWYFTYYAIFAYVVIGILILLSMVFSIKRYYKKKKEYAIAEYENESIRKIAEERLLNEQIIVKLKNENLQKEVSYKSKELAISAMSLIKKNEILMNIKDEIENQKEDLGQRYPDKFYKSLIKKIDTNLNSSDEWEIFENNFNQTHNNLFKRLKERSPDLTSSDLRLCAFLRLNLASKEIAPLLGISVRGVETHRYRLRKKFNMESDDNLFEFILQD